LSGTASSFELASVPEASVSMSEVTVKLRPTVLSASPSWSRAHIWGLRPDLY
jgi:hypothetical protein